MSVYTMTFNQSSNVDTRGSTFFDIGRDLITVNNFNIYVHLSLLGSGRRPHRYLRTDMSPRNPPIRMFSHLAADLSVDTAIRLVVQITELLVDHRHFSSTHRDLEHELKLLHQTLILTGLAIREYNDRPMGESLGNAVKPEVERCCTVLLEILDNVSSTRQGLVITSIGHFWRPVFDSRWDGGELVLLKTILCHSQRSLGGFLMALNSVAWIDLANEFSTGYVPFSKFHALLNQRLPFLGHIRVNAVQVIDHLGRTIPVPAIFCSTWKTFNYVINGYCKDRPGSRFVERGDYEVIRSEDNQKINRSEFALVVASEMVLEISIVIRQRKHFQDNKERCPRCNHVNSNVTTNNGWIECRDCLGYFQVAAVSHNDKGISGQYGDDREDDDRASHRESDEERGGEFSERHTEDHSQEIISSAPQPKSIDATQSDTIYPKSRHDDETKYFRRIHVICTGLASLWSSHDFTFLGQSNSQAAKLNTISNEELEPLKLYENLVLFLSKKISKLEPTPQRASCLDTLGVCVEQMKTTSNIQNLARNDDYRTQLMALSRTLKCSDDRDIREALDADEAYIAQTLRSVLSNDTHRKTVLQLQNSDAERFLTVTRNVVDNRMFRLHDDDSKTQRDARRLLVKLSEKCGILPSSLSITGVDNCSQEPVAGGGFADIYLASYKGKRVALKCLRDFHIYHERELIHKKFCREAALWQGLKHSNILPFYGVDLETFLPRLCMVSAWMPQGTIMKHIQDLGGPMFANVVRYLCEIAQGLQFLHSCNIIHGDLRGANIFIDDGWHVRIADFGMTVFTATLGGTVSNPVRWMAPELLDPEAFGLKESRRTTASDIYAFACVGLEIHTMRYPFSDIPRDSNVIRQVSHGERPKRPTGEIEKGMSNDLWNLLQSCWQQRPSDRPKMADIVARIEV